MGYRDEIDAAQARRTALRDELSALADDDPKRAETAEALDGVDRAIDEMRTKRALFVLSKVRIAMPCHASWDAMSGDDRSRHCALCEKNVYDVSGLSAVEAMELLSRGGETCLRLYRRRDGTVITADCEVGRRHRRRLAIAGTIVTAGGIAAATVLGTSGGEDRQMAAAHHSRCGFTIDEDTFFGGVERRLEADEVDPRDAERQTWELLVEQALIESVEQDGWPDSYPANGPEAEASNRRVWPARDVDARDDDKRVGPGATDP